MQGGAITTSNGASFIVQSGTLEGVTVNGVLDVGNSYNRANLTVSDGLVLNGTALVGNSSNSQSGAISFAGNQVLGGSGTVVFGNGSGYWGNALLLANDGTTLVIGSGITVRGQNGVIGSGAGYWVGGPASVSLVNQGTVSCDVSGGTITVNAQPFSNQGLAQGVNGGTLTLSGGFSNAGVLSVGAGSGLNFGGSWVNTGMINATNGTVNLGGAFSLADLGEFNRSGGVVYVSGTLDNTNATLALSDAAVPWVLQGGAVQGGAITTANGASFIVQSGTLEGVTVNGVLDVGNSYNRANLTVSDGLVLNGTALVGNSSNSQPGAINFAGNQVLGGSGTVVFGNGSGYWGNALLLANDGTTLVIGSGITVRGQNGVIGSGAGYWVGGPASVSLVNQGTVSCDVSGGTITVNAQPFSNQGLAQGVNGGTLTLSGGFSNAGVLNVGAGSGLNFGGSWVNTGTINATNGTVNLGGAFSLADLGEFNRSGGVVYVSGTLDNTNAMLALSDAAVPWVLQGGAVQGGAITTANGASFIVQSGTLDGVTVNGVLDVGNSYNRANLTVSDGLVLNGTALVGNSSNSQSGAISFAGNQVLGGSGTVVFGNGSGYWGNALLLANDGTTLVIGSGITVRGQNGVIGSGAGYWVGGPASVSLVNQGTVSCDVSGGTITVNAQPFSNQGLAQGVNGGTLTLSGGFSNAGVLSVGAGSGLNFGGSWVNTGMINATNGTVNLGGAFSLADLGEFNRSGGVVYVSGTLDNTNAMLALSDAAVPWVLRGGAVQGGAITTSNGASFIVQSGTLDGVTVNGVLDVGNSYNRANLTVSDGLVLNGTALVGNSSNSQSGAINFAGNQVLGGSGTVVFGNGSGYWGNALLLANDGTTLVIGSGITVRGQNGVIGSGAGYWVGGPASVSLVNQGTVSCDVSGGTITVNAQPFSNQGLAQGVNGGTLTLSGGFSNAGVLSVGAGSGLNFGGSWVNTGMINATNGTVNLGGAFSLADLGEFNRSGGVVYVSGTLDNTNATLALSDAAVPWVSEVGRCRAAPSPRPTVRLSSCNPGRWRG